MTATATRTAPVESSRSAARHAFGALLLRDIRVLFKEKWIFIGRTIMQPLLLIFVFTYVFPKIGEAIGGRPSDFATLLVGGTIASAMIFQGVQAVALPLVQDFGYTREIEDRVLAPMPVWAVAAEKVAGGAIQALLASLVVFPLALFIPANKVHLGTRVEPRQVPLIFSLLVIPMTFLGAVYYPWRTLTPLPWLKVAVLINPLIYMSEGMRVALTHGVPHMAVIAIYLALIAFTAVFLKLGIDGFKKRVLS
jgi:ABC-2 type transport system permease protein